jgi:hypothetical protein
MNIKTLEQMETIVSANPQLSWDGWDVVHLSQSNTAMFKTNGAFVDNKWCIRTVYSPDQNGWKISQKHLES